MNGENLNNRPEEQVPPTSNKKSTIKAVFKEVLIFSLIAFGIVLPFRFYIAEPYLVDGRSMYPTFNTSEYLIVDKFSYRIKNPERNSVVVFKYPNNPDKNFIKRIIGLPGETVIIKDNQVTIINNENPEGFVLDEPYVVYKSPSYSEINLGGEEYFVMGDNRAESFDSRSWGPLSAELILGKPVLRLLPITKFSINPGSIDKF